MSNALFDFDLWRPALEKYAVAAHLTVQLFDADGHVVIGPLHETPLFQLFNKHGYDPGILAECARQCLAQTRDRPAVIVSQVYGLTVIGTSLVLDGKTVGAAAAGYAFVDFSQLLDIQRMAHDAGIGFEQLWRVAREQKPVPRGRLVINAELLQVLGDSVLRENSRTRQYEQTALKLQETATALRQSEDSLAKELAATKQLQSASAQLIEGGNANVLYDKILDAAIAIMQANMGSMQILDEGRDALRILTWRGFDSDFGKIFEFVLPDTKTACSAARRAGHRVVVPDVEASDFIAGGVENHRKLGIRAVQSTPLFSRAGHLLGMISTHWRTPHTPEQNSLHLLDILARQAADLLERKQGEAARTRLAAIVESSDDAIISKDLAGSITSWNRGAQRLFGYTEQEAIGQPTTMLMPANRYDEERQILEHILRGEPVEHFETVRRRKDGTLVEISLTVSPIIDGDGKIVGASKIAHDITDRKRAESALRHSHDDLEHTVEQRTAALRELSSSLLHAQDDERRRLSRELHDSLGQYLAYAKMSLEALARPGATEKETQNFEALRDTLDQSLSEIRTLSYLLHPPTLDELGLPSAVRWYVEGFSQRSGIQVNLHLPEGVERLPGMMELVLFRILQESLTNIHRHSGSRSVDIRLEVHAAEVVLQVRDYGRGMPAELLENFRSGTGFGVGLRGMRQRITELDGRFEIQSDENGTSIRASIPLSNAGTNSATKIAKAAGT